MTDTELFTTDTILYGENLKAFVMESIEVDGVYSRNDGCITSAMFSLRYDMSEEREVGGDGFVYLADVEIDEERWIRNKELRDKKTGKDVMQIAYSKRMYDW